VLWGAKVSQYRYVFVIGCARSGTTAMAKLLNTSAHVCVTNERFTRLWYHEIDQCSPALFEAARLMDVRNSDSYASQAYITDKPKAFAAKCHDAKLIGDKAPRLHAHLEKMRAIFPGARFVFMLRNIYDVSNSFEARADSGRFWSRQRRTEDAVREWNASLENVIGAMGNDVFVVCYEEFFHKRRGLAELVQFLHKIPADVKPKAVYATASRLNKVKRDRVDSAGRLFIEENACIDLYLKTLAFWHAWIG